MINGTRVLSNQIRYMSTASTQVTAQRILLTIGIAIGCLLVASWNIAIFWRAYKDGRPIQVLGVAVLFVASFGIVLLIALALGTSMIVSLVIGYFVALISVTVATVMLTY